MIRDLRRTGVCAAIALSLASGPLGAAEKQTLDDGWSPGWSRIGPIETAVIGGLGLGALLLEVAVKPASMPRGAAPLLFRADAQRTAPDNTAFFSGHTSTAFTMAAGLCVQHSRLEIYGGAADKIVCPAALAVAATTGLLRIVSDRHWTSDVLGGAIFGTVL